MHSSFDRHSHYVLTHSENLSLRHREGASHWLQLLLLLHLYALDSFHTFFLQAVLQIKDIFHQKSADNFLSLNEVRPIPCQLLLFYEQQPFLNSKNESN